jgi:tRNA (guanine26-N2/guanine27-N2)-dimethyltransferase
MEYISIQEGQVKIKIPKFEKLSSKVPVFYNPVMELNRDLSVAALQHFRQGLDDNISICDAFGGSGIRGIRYAKEISGVSFVVVNDLNPLAVRLAHENIHMNGLKHVKAYKEDANILLRKCRGKFDVVDIDPFGTPTPYVESAAASLKADGMICVTATDTSALCGTYKKPCIRKYGAVPLKTEYCHETGLRILAGFLGHTFAKYKKYLEFQFSHSTEHYMRIYAKVGKGAKKTDKSLENMGYVAHCPRCLNRVVLKGLNLIMPLNCPQCGGSWIVGGPLWCGNIQDSDFINGMLEILTEKKINRKKEALKLVVICKDEANSPPTFYDLHALCHKLKISVPPLVMIMDSLKNNGYHTSRTHFNPNGIKTDAPLSAVEKIILHLKKDKKVD